jgi:hypothetical protein
MPTDARYAALPNSPHTFPGIYFPKTGRPWDMIASLRETLGERTLQNKNQQTALIRNPAARKTPDRARKGILIFFRSRARKSYRDKNSRRNRRLI